ncbi:MAG: KdsC family phosphatase [Thermosulfidibacteraceae bacterium]
MQRDISKISLLILDVDGVLTGGEILVDDDGKEVKCFNVRDGHGIVMLHRVGVKTAIITGRISKAVDVRAKELGIEIVYQGAHNKLKVYEEIKKKYGFKDEEIAYIGDDVVDIPILKRVGFAVAVSDAHPEVKKYVHYVTRAKGGRGAVREIADMIIRAKDKWEEIIERYLR